MGIMMECACDIFLNGWLCVFICLEFQHVKSIIGLMLSWPV